jgi:hypothetical protein
MENIIIKGISQQLYFSMYLGWGFYFSAGYLSCKNIWVSFFNESYTKIRILMLAQRALVFN